MTEPYLTLLQKLMRELGGTFPVQKPEVPPKKIIFGDAEDVFKRGLNYMICLNKTYKILFNLELLMIQVINN